CSISFSLIISKLFYNLDLREHGSGNVGTTNTFRILGKKAGIIVLIIHLLKGAIPVWVAMLVDGTRHYPVIIFGVVAALGHVYSIFLNFYGGQAVATAGVAIFPANPLFFLVLIITFLLTLHLSIYVSLSRVFAALVLIIVVCFTGDWFMFIFGIVLGLVVIIKHIPNMKRIKDGSEPKLTFM